MSPAWVLTISDRIILPLAAVIESEVMQAAMISGALAPR